MFYYTAQRYHFQIYATVWRYTGCVLEILSNQYILDFFAGGGMTPLYYVNIRSATPPLGHHVFSWIDSVWYNNPFSRRGDSMWPPRNAIGIRAAT